MTYPAWKTSQIRCQDACQEDGFWKKLNILLSHQSAHRSCRGRTYNDDESALHMEVYGKGPEAGAGSELKFISVFE